MTSDVHSRLRRILQLALSSPYEGEREKAATRLLGLLEQAGFSLRQLDPSFGSSDGPRELRERARLPVDHVRSLKSREEAMLYGRLLERIAGPDLQVQIAETNDGYELHSCVRSVVQDTADRAFQVARVDLAGSLSSAQKQALSEYQRRREVLFTEAVAALADRTLID